MELHGIHWGTMWFIRQPKKRRLLLFGDRTTKHLSCSMTLHLAIVIVIITNKQFIWRRRIFDSIISNASIIDLFTYQILSYFNVSYLAK